MIKNDNYYVVQGWMVSKLKLSSGAKRDIYAIIYGFSQDGDNEYNGSIQYLMDYTGYSKRHVIRILQELCEENLICKQEEFRNGVKFVKYKANLNVLNVTGGEKMSPGGGDIMSPNNIELYTIDTISNSNELDNISYPPEKNFIPIKQKTNVAVVEENPLPGPLPAEVENFLKDSYEKYPSTKYQIDKQGNKYFTTTLKDLEKLDKEYGEETVRTVLRFIKQDEFRCKQIQSIGKLRKKNKDGVPYIVVIMDKMMGYKPKCVKIN